jgi:hypothetical protein
MAKTLNIKLESSEEPIRLFGINTVIKDYQLSVLINQALDLNLKLTSFDGFLDEFSVYTYSQACQSFVLLQNKNNQNIFALDKLKSFEYILLISDAEQIDVLSCLNNKDDIIYLGEIDLDKITKKEIGQLKQLLTS